MALQQPIRSGTSSSDREIPDKLYFRIGEVARLCDVPAYVLRFWESEFPQLKPNKGGTGQRLYRRRDVEMALHVKTLLYSEGYTIAGARQFLKSEPRLKEPRTLSGVEALPREAAVPALAKLRNDLQELLTMLSEPPTNRPKGASVHSIRAVKLKLSTAKTEPPRLFDDL